MPGNVSAERAASYLKWEKLYDLVIIANVVVSLGLFWFTRRRKVDHPAVCADDSDYPAEDPGHRTPCRLDGPARRPDLEAPGCRARRQGRSCCFIARGGMGEVWQATHRFLVRPAAIKLIKSEAVGAGNAAQASVVVQRFRREARAAGALRSPHTIQLYDFGVAADGTFYYVMELLNGMDLQNLVAQYGPLPPARTIHILKQVCESLGEAHTRGLIHRDIKPANIQICRMGGSATSCRCWISVWLSEPDRRSRRSSGSPRPICWPARQPISRWQTRLEPEAAVTL